jgi:hypothetical protein
MANPDAPLADVTAVEVQGDPQAYRFAVTIASPDTGCDLYADWWEVITPNEDLIYRRILAHSHVQEQPFTRSGGPVQIDPDQEVIIRAHMHPGGYGGQAWQGTVTNGFEKVEFDPDFAEKLKDEAPLPDGCAF